MLTRVQDQLFSHAARLALRGNYAARDGDKPSALRPLLESWRELEFLAAQSPSPARKVAAKILVSLEAKKPGIEGDVDNDAMRQFGQECVLLFKIGRGDDPALYPLEFGDYY